jgi:hypothetical protein
MFHGGDDIWFIGDPSHFWSASGDCGEGCGWVDVHLGMICACMYGGTIGLMCWWYDKRFYIWVGVMFILPRVGDSPSPKGDIGSSIDV